MEGIGQDERRKLPEREIGGIVFLIDATEMVLIDKERPDNRLAAREMENSPQGHYFILDKRERKIEPFAGRMYADSERFVAVNIPRLEALDPDGMRMLIDQGKIPMPTSHFNTISIMGTDFYFTDRSNFQQVENPWNIVPASEFQKHRAELGFWYNQAEKRVAFATEIPSGTDSDGSGEVRFIPILELLKQLGTEVPHQQPQRDGDHTRRSLGR